ncbi:short-chain dehydrogenase/reductase [Mycobacterium sp. GA-1841]|uniref:SDR family oxidoreductase n=1 Tax=Mycobacterium sp. GA-1841 TaxID=1834154 RepID=UPI00096EE59A|nr:SDR family oxidoreductase [Mycobacterium sp. GA-1841]OMC31914.1 short-chain dehydrogenase/reductase [Mycobacterium sp. GA-1841]
MGDERLREEQSTSEPRTVLITGASRGLGFASAVRLYRDGWRVAAAMRTPDQGMPLLRKATGAGDDDDRLIGVQLDLMDAASITAAAKTIEEAVGAPYAVVHNAGISAAGMVEETSSELWERMFATNVFGPVALTKALLPAMRGAGRGRIVLISSAAGVRGMPATAPYSAVKGALERWGEAMAGEVAPFGIGVTILVTGTYDTDIITDAGTTDERDLDGPYAPHHRTMDKRGRAMMKHAARSPEDFAGGLAKALNGDKPFAKTAVGPDARMLLVANRLLPSAGLHQMTRVMMGIPRHGAMRGGAYPLTTSQKAMVVAAKVLPQPVLIRLASLAAKRSAAKNQPQQGSATDV